MLHQMIRDLPAVRDILYRTNFDAVATVSLADFDELDGATGWAASQWRAGGCRYCRRVAAAEQTAVFEFGDDLTAVTFKLLFG